MLVLSLAVVVTVAIRTPQAPATSGRDGNIVSVSGDTATIDVPINLAIRGGVSEVGPESVSDFNDLAREINDFWNSRLAKLRYKSCVKVKINVSINPYIAGPEMQPPGHDLDFLPENGHWEQGALKRPLLWLPPGETDPTADSADSYANSQSGRWTGTMVELGIRSFAITPVITAQFTNPRKECCVR